MTLTGSDATSYDLGNGDYLILITEYTYKLELSSELRYDADGLTRTTQLHKIKSTGDVVVSVEDSTFVSRGTWDVPWQSFTITEKKVDGEWVALEPPVAHTLSTEDRSSFTLDDETVTWTVVP